MITSHSNLRPKNFGFKNWNMGDAQQKKGKEKWRPTQNRRQKR
jgi:hypothetical protein